MIVYPFDSSKEKNDEMLKYLTDKLGGLDLLIYSSGIGIVNKELDYDIEQKVNNLNVNGFTQVVGWGFNYFKIRVMDKYLI